MTSFRKTRSRIGRLLPLFVLPLLLSTAVSAGTGPGPGDEIWVDGPDAVQPGNDRVNPDVAVDNTGRRIHVWQAFASANRNDIYMRRFDHEGNPLVDPQLVNTTVDDDQWRPRLAVAADGSFLVIWESNELHPVIGVDRDVVRSQAYNANGDPEGTEQLLSANPLPGALGLNADVAALRAAGGVAGGYAVVWMSAASSGDDPGFGIEGCLVSAQGVPSAQFQIPADGDGTQDEPSVTELQDGGFLVTWQAASQVWGRRFNSAGGPIGNDFVISTSFVAQKLKNDAAIGWNGRVIVAWADQEDNGGINGREIYARLFDADLNPLGPDFLVNTVITDEQAAPRVADFGPWGFLVVWESDVASGPDTANSIEARVVSGPNQFDADGDGVDDPQFQLNVWDNSSSQQFPGSHGWYGRLAANWRSLTWDGDPPPDNINDDFIIGRDNEGCIFCSDMDWHDSGGSGNLFRWSSKVGVEP